MPLENDVDVVRLSVRDNDPDFDVEPVQVNPQHGIGLCNMREHMVALGGICAIASDSHDTEVCTVLPYVVIVQPVSTPSSPPA